MINDCKQILLLPIEIVAGKEKHIEIKDNKILSTQSYRGRDPDVSDAAIDFYFAIYNKIIVENKSLKDKNFCGDTMMSYKSLKRIYGIDNNPDKTYCLANFWILPMHVGHSSPWTAKQNLMYLSKSAKCGDDMWRFLQFHEKERKSFRKEYKVYEDFFENFIEKHMLNGIEFDKLNKENSAEINRENFAEILEKRADNLLCRKINEIEKMLKDWIINN